MLYFFKEASILKLEILGLIVIAAIALLLPIGLLYHLAHWRRRKSKTKARKPETILLDSDPINSKETMVSFCDLCNGHVSIPELISGSR